MTEPENGPLRVLFVGGDFARKGGRAVRSMVCRSW